ncbi:MAG: arginine N-succinyltransferase [Alphaproteobacteria bacterium]|nr:arginine N-succinyltransferase [Alphaproteobacteria bacterium]
MSAAPLVPDYVIRAARADDMAAFAALRTLAGPGFTSLMIGDEALAARLALSERSFAAAIAAPGDERYVLALEHIPSGALVGTAALKATVGSDPPFFNFRQLRIAQASHAADRRFDMDVLILVNEFTGCSEVGSLFLREEHRAGGVGRALAQSRYLLIAADRARFNERVVSELRGVVSSDGRSPFWDALGRHFFRMEFREADRLSATTDNQFILDLMPKYPIYVDLLPDAARAVIGETHPDGAGARRLLEWEGFRFDNVVDIFEGGPLVSAPRDTIRTVREAKRLSAHADERMKSPAPVLAANAKVAGFRCARFGGRVEGGALHAHPSALSAIGVRDGGALLVWSAEG